jgi:flagellar hook assembly protein FlgD
VLRGHLPGRASGGDPEAGCGTRGAQSDAGIDCDPAIVVGAAPVGVEIYDAEGRRVRELARGTLPEGEQIVNWDGPGDDVRALPPGVYFARILQGARQAEAKLVRVE